MKRKILIVIILVLIKVGFAHAQSTANLQNQLNQTLANETGYQSCITNNNISTANCTTQLAAAVSQASSLQNAINILTVQNAQTAAQVNWPFFTGLEVVGLRMANWGSAAAGVNWSSIIPTLGIACSVTEASVNWSNFPVCAANGVNGGLPYGNWATGIAAFYCGQGSIAGTC